MILSSTTLEEVLRLRSLRTFTVFYSWQSDHPSDLCRTFIAQALKAKGSAHLILTMNTAFGGPQELPFDLRHPLQHEAASDLGPSDRRKLRAQFAERLVVALNAVIDQPAARKKAASKGS